MVISVLQKLHGSLTISQTAHQPGKRQTRLHFRLGLRPLTLAGKKVRRILDVTERQLRRGKNKASWSHRRRALASLICSALKTLKETPGTEDRTLRESAQAVASLKSKLDHIDYPLAQLRITAEGRRNHRQRRRNPHGAHQRPIAPRFRFETKSKSCARFPSRPRNPARGRRAGTRSRTLVSARTRAGGIRRAQSKKHRPLIARQSIESNPRAPGALVNLGTIAFRSRKMKEAESLVSRAPWKPTRDIRWPISIWGICTTSRAISIDARKHYVEAIRLNPRYADAYFNLALLCERNGDLLQAIGNWQTYLKLDSNSSVGKHSAQSAGPPEEISPLEVTRYFISFFDHRSDGRKVEKAVVLLAVDKERGRSSHTGVLAFMLLKSNPRFELVAVHVGGEAVHIEPDIFRIAHASSCARDPGNRHKAIVHLPELTLSLRGKRGFGAKLRLRMEIERELFEDELHILREILHHCLRLRHSFGTERALEIGEFDDRHPAHYPDPWPDRPR